MINTVRYEDVKEIWDYIEFYPEEDDEEFDGVHYGGIKGIKPDAPPEAKIAFQNYIQQSIHMNEIERILHKYFSDEELEYRSLSGRLDDPAWMEKHGYTKTVKSGYGVSSELTPEGKKFVKESEKRISMLINKILNKRASSDEETRAVREIRSYLWSKPDMNVEDELSDELYYVYLSLSPDY